ncbi:MAG TPA: flagellar hook-basal body complex protein FliE [Caulobacteraceae bacterium]|nr:flagellar hook-basal body complex protein FliE [Caulobacteraceae bacterium]
MASPLAALQAYTSAANLAGAATPAKEAAGPGFGQMLSQVLGDTINSTRAAEQQMANHVAGKAELVDVVTAISSAESSLETVMAIRDQVISAYQEILRMPI